MDKNNQTDGNTEELHQKLNLETGKIGWQELQRYFARNLVINISNKLDLVTVAAEFSNDNSIAVEQWTTNGLVTRANDDDARRWHESNAVFWAIVVTPWVLVQEIPE